MDLIEAYQEYLLYNRGRSRETATKYGGYLERLREHLQPAGKTITAASYEDLEEFSGLAMHQAGLSPRSRRALVAALRGFFGWARERGHVATNPAAELPYPTAGRRLPRPMQLRNAEKLLMQPDLSDLAGVRDAAMMATLMGTGLRISGLCALNQGDLVFTEVEGTEWLVIRVREKGDRERLVPVPHETRLLIRAYLGHPDLEAIDRTLPNGDQVLWVSLRNRTVPPHKYHGENRRLAARSFHDRIKHHSQAAGLPEDEDHAHAMRHLYGTELAESDVDVLTRQALMGHEDPKSTEVYTHLAMRKLSGVVEQANPLGKMNTPVTGLRRQLEGK